MAAGSSAGVPHLVPFTVGDWLVEPTTCRISRGETIVKLRPQLADLLVCLARHAGNTVPKDDILAEVWPGQFVADSGLSRCVAELRQSLRDDAQNPRYIETIPKRGYRLIAPVVWLEKPPPASAPAARVPSRAPVPRRVWVMTGVALLAAVVIGAALLVRSPASALTERDTVLLADVRNTTGDRVFDDTLRLALAVHLEQAPFVRILRQEAVHAAMMRAGRPPGERVEGPVALEVCRREGAAVLLAGSIAPLGSRYAVGLEAVACGTGEELGRALVEASDKEHVLSALEEVATRIRRRLGESRDSLRQHDVPLVQATTPSLDALKALTLGDYNRDHARLDEALAAYRHATELDPQFALAWARRGVAARNLDLVEELSPALQRAYELRARVTPPERFYIEAHYHQFEKGNIEKSLETYREWKRRYPRALVPSSNISSLLSNWLGRYDEALAEAREALQLAPYSSICYSQVVVASRGAGRLDEARKALADAVSRGAGDRLVHDLLFRMAVFDGDRDAIEREIRWAARDPLSTLLTLRVRAAEAMRTGRLKEARQLWSDAVAKAREAGLPRRVARVHLEHAEGEALVGDRGAARAAVEAGLAAHDGPTVRVAAAIVLDLIGETARAHALLGGIDPRSPLDPETLRVWLPLAQALNAAARGDADGARGMLAQLAPFERGSEFFLVPLGARAIVEQRGHRPAEAAAAFEELVRLRPIDSSSPWVAHAQLGLARALRESGDAARSVAAYDAWLASWKDADADAPLLATVRRERAALVR